MPALQRLPGVSQIRPQPALPPLQPDASSAARLPGLRQPGHRRFGPRHGKNRRTLSRTAARHATPGRLAAAHRAHRRRLDARQRRTGTPTGRSARRRCGSAGRHANGGQGSRFPPRHTGGRAQPGRRFVQRRLSRTRTLVCLVIASGRPGRAGCCADPGSGL